MLLCTLDSNIHIANDFNLKLADGNTADSETSTNKEETNKRTTEAPSNQPNEPISQRVQLDQEKRVVPNDRETVTSVESSPVMGVKRGAEEKKKLKSAAAEPLTDIEEGFIRSLSRCVPWAARGGKSGSTFCKTTGKNY